MWPLLPHFVLNSTGLNHSMSCRSKNMYRMIADLVKILFERKIPLRPFCRKSVKISSTRLRPSPIDLYNVIIKSNEKDNQFRIKIKWGAFQNTLQLHLHPSNAAKGCCSFGPLPILLLISCRVAWTIQHTLLQFLNEHLIKTSEDEIPTVCDCFVAKFVSLYRSQSHFGV